MDETPPLQIGGSNGHHLRFQLRQRGDDEAIYGVCLRAGWMTAETEMTTYLYGPPTKFFEDMASSWRGWDGQKTWAEIEGRVSFAATIDRLGHVALNASVAPSLGGQPANLFD
jgi:hypothetical protein